MIKLLFLIAGGAVGTVLRYSFSGLISKTFRTDFPYGTLGVNIIGCLIIGFLASVTERKFLLSPNLRIMLMIGFCGAFTTFSTFILETANLIKYGDTMRAFANVIISVAVGFILFRIGMLIGDAV